MRLFAVLGAFRLMIGSVAVHIVNFIALTVIINKDFQFSDVHEKIHDDVEEFTFDEEC